MKFKALLPLLLVELYLLITLLLVFYGPVNWNITNSSTLIGFVLLYHLSFIVGYIVKWKSKVKLQVENKPYNYNLVVKFYWLIVALAFLGCIVSFKNVTMSDKFVYGDILESIKIGILDPAYARNLYAEKLFSGEYKGNKYLTSSLLVLGVFKYLLLPILVFNWRRLNLVKRSVGILIAIIPIMSGIAMSLSSINFFYFFTISVCLFVVFISNDAEDSGFKGLYRRKGVIVSLVFMFLFSFWQFYAVKSGTTLYSAVVNQVKPATFDYMTANGIEFKRSDDYSLLNDFYEKITVYIAQGYKGMSISLEEEWDSTYGVGHSVFLQRVFEDYLGFDVRERTYQRKITSMWDENIYWHSAYSYFANDVSFYGVILVMFVLGYYFSKVVLAAVYEGDFVAKSLLPLFALMFLYLPANNQVFSFLENMTAFWMLTAMFIYLSSDFYKKMTCKIATSN